MNIEDIDLANIRAFELVATLGTMSAAARRIGLTVPAIAAKIKRLESDLGCKLFKRVGNRIDLTYHGEVLLQASSKLLAEGRLLIRSIEDMKRGKKAPVEHLAIAIGGDYLSLFLPIIENFLRCRPRARIKTRITRPADALQLLRSGRVDLCLGVFPNLPEAVTVEQLAITSMSLLNPAEFTDIPCEHRVLLLAPKGIETSRLHDQAGFDADRVLECPTCQSAISLAMRSNLPAVVHTLCLRISEHHGAPARELADQRTTQIVAAYLNGDQSIGLLGLLLRRLRADTARIGRYEVPLPA